MDGLSGGLAKTKVRCAGSGTTGIYRFSTYRDTAHANWENHMTFSEEKEAAEVGERSCKFCRPMTALLGVPKDADSMIIIRIFRPTVCT